MKSLLSFPTAPKFCAFFVLACGLFFVPEASADLGLGYTNTDPSTLQISDDLIGNNTADTRLYALFNDFFKLTGENAYTSSNELYQDRGVKANVVGFEATEGAKMVASFKSAGFSQTLSFTDTQGNILRNDDGTAVFSKTYPGGEGQRFTEDLVDFPVVGAYGLMLDVDTLGGHDMLYSDYTMNPGGMINLIAIDVTDLMQSLYPELAIETAFMFAWEDRPLGGSYLDWDYQDLAFVAVNLTPTFTPEPGTALIFGLALCALPFTRQRQRSDAGPR